MKGLEALKSINEIQLNYSEAKHGILFPRDICPDEFAIIEKELKALNVIKRVSHYDLPFLDYLLDEHSITQEEYDLLKEVLKNEY